jgi:PKD repeat protein
VADTKSCQTKPIASTADYLNRKAGVGSLLPITARDLGSKYGFTFDPLTDERRTTYNDVYLGECLTALLQYLQGQQITPGSGGDNPPAPVAPPLTGVRIYGPKSIYAGETAILVARATGGSPQVAFDWDAEGINPRSLNKDRSIQSIQIQTPGSITITATANDSGVTQTGTFTLEVQALPSTPVPVPAEDIEIDGIGLYSSSPVIVGKPAFFAATARQGTDIQWSWDFGDGSPAANNQIDAHAFQTVGNYTVKLTATNAKGEKSYTDSDGQEGYKVAVITDPSAITYDTDIDSENIRVPMPDPIYTGVNYDFGAFLMDKVVENPQWGWSFNPVKDDGTPAQSGDQIGSRYWGSGQIEDNKWSDDQAGNHTIWIRLVYGPKNARRTVYSSEIVTVKPLPKAGPTPTPTPTGPTYDTVINPQDITVPIPANPYVGVEYQLAAFLETKRVENPDWWFTFDPMDGNSQPIESGDLIDRRAWKAGQVEDMLFTEGQDGPHWVWAKLEYGATNARQTVFEKFAISVKKLPGSDQPTIQPLSAGDLRFIVLPQSDPFATEQMNDPKVAPVIHSGEFAVMYIDTQNRPFPSGTSFLFTLFTGGSEINTGQPYVVLPYPGNNTPPPSDTATVVVQQPGAPAITLTRPITIVKQSLTGKPLAATDLFFYAYPPEYPTARITEFGLNSKPFPVKIGTRVPLMIRTRLGMTFPPNTRFEFYTDIKYGAWVPTRPTIGVPAYICDLTGVDGDTTKPVTSQPGPYHAYATVRQPGVDDITLTIPLDLQAADAPAGTPVDANSVKLAVYPPNIKEPGEIVSYLTSDKPMPIKAGTRIPIMIATLETFPQGTTFTFGTTLILEGKVPHFVPIHIPIYLMDLTGEDGSQAGTQQITVTISQPGAADITLSRDVFYQTVDPPAPPDTNPVSPWEIDLKAQGLRGGIARIDRLEPGMTYYLLPEVTGRNVRGVLKIAMGLDSQLYDATKEPSSPASTFVWLDGDPKDTKRYHFYNDNVSEEQSPEDFNPRNPAVDDQQAASLITDGQVRGPDDRFMYFVLFYPQDENGKNIGDPIVRGFYPQVVELGHIITGFPGEPDQSAAITVSGQPQQGYVMNTEYTLTAGVKRGFVVDGDFTYMWFIGEPSDTAPDNDPRVWQSADSNGRFVVKFDQRMIVDPDDPNYKNLKFKLWVKLVIHHKDGHDSQTISNPFILLANPG